MRRHNASFTAAAWVFVAYLAAVILFGAWVRISHSGDGCGSNWPTCHGEVLPSDPSAATLTEFTHRVTSGLCGVFVLLLLGWSWRLFRWGRVTRAVAWTLLFILFEGAIGAGLVLGGLVGDDDSVARAIVIALHLTNTLALMACAVLAAWRSSHPGAGPFLARRRLAFAAGLALLVLTAMSGAVTALGDTLFPGEVRISPGLFTAVSDDWSAGTHFLVRLRVLHPAVALLAAGYLLWLLRPEADTCRWAGAAMYLVAAEVAIGFANIALAAPGWLQLVHLLVAQGLWVSVVLACAATGTRPGRVWPAGSGGLETARVAAPE